MQRTRIKICGVTTAGDAVSAANAGADAIGMVFHPVSKRCISMETAAAIIGALPPFATTVGLFVDAPLRIIREHAEVLHLDVVQLHGNETPDFVRDLYPVRTIKAIRVSPDHFESELAMWRTEIAAQDLTNLVGIVLETPATAEPGGTGQPNDWQHVKAVHDRGGFTGLPSIIAAGGLTPQNVDKVIRMTRPYAVDVSTGVEREIKGRKDPVALAVFCDAVRQADRFLGDNSAEV